MKNVLIICLISLFCSGCSILFPKKMEWPMPEKPEISNVQFHPIQEINPIEGFNPVDGFYLTRGDAKILADNIDELKAYIKKMEVLVEKMKKYYGAK